ncbi:MAG: hypothetical protein KJ638_13480, partial [Chloroflexi bacterium]|nr:hypothetical protein [Chloroflexota bacterium]
KAYDLGIEDTVTVAATRRTRPTPVLIGEVYQPALFGSEPVVDHPTAAVAAIDIQAMEQPSLL